MSAIDSTVMCLRTRHHGQTVLAVGHSNTVPQIVEALSGEKVPPFREDRLSLLTLAPRRPAKVLAMHYGGAPPR